MARIQVSKDSSGRIIVSFPYDPLLVEKVKSVDGRRWHPVEKHWSFPHLCGMLEKILKVFGDEEIHLDPPLKTATSKIKDTPSPLGPKGTVPGFVVSAQSNDLQTYNHSIPSLEKGGEGGFESGLSPKFAFEDLRRELVSRKYSYTPHFCKSAGCNCIFLKQAPSSDLQRQTSGIVPIQIPPRPPFLKRGWNDYTSVNRSTERSRRSLGQSPSAQGAREYLLF
jgi:hypothetical protein